MPKSYHDFARIIGSTGLAVKTIRAKNIASNSADVEGELVGLGSASSADVQFEYRKTGASTFQTTSKTTFSTPVTFTQTVSGLTAGTNYEFRFKATGSGGSSDQGALLTFSTAAAPTTFIDDFERGDITPYSGDTSSFAAVTNDVANGTYALEANAPDTKDHGILSEPGGTLDNYPTPADTVRWLHRVPSVDTDPGLLLNGGIRAGSFFAHSVELNKNKMVVRRYDNATPSGMDTTNIKNSRVQVASTSISVTPDTYYWCEFDLPDESGDFEYRVYDYDSANDDKGALKQTLSGNSTAHILQTGVGAAVRNTGQATIIDDITIENSQSFTSPEYRLIDDFERDGLPYSQLASSSGHNGFELTQNNVIQNSEALETLGGSPKTEARASEPGEGLCEYPATGDTVVYLVQSVDGDTVPGLVFNADVSNQSWYASVIDTTNIFIARYDNPGSRTFISSTSVSLNDNSWYWSEVDIPDASGNMALRIYNVDTNAIQNNNYASARGSNIASISTTDTTYSGDGIGFQTEDSGTGTILDWIAIKP